jgi:stalled ribosome alternative rescue factor ArfA
LVSETAQTFRFEQEENAKGKGAPKKAKTPGASTWRGSEVKNLYL